LAAKILIDGDFGGFLKSTVKIYQWAGLSILDIFTVDEQNRFCLM